MVCSSSSDKKKKTNKNKSKTRDIAANSSLILKIKEAYERKKVSQSDKKEKDRKRVNEALVVAAQILSEYGAPTRGDALKKRWALKKGRESKALKQVIEIKNGLDLPTSTPCVVAPIPIEEIKQQITTELKDKLYKAFELYETQQEKEKRDERKYDKELKKQQKQIEKEKETERASQVKSAIVKELMKEEKSKEKKRKKIEAEREKEMRRLRKLEAMDSRPPLYIEDQFHRDHTLARRSNYDRSGRNSKQIQYPSLKSIAHKNANYSYKDVNEYQNKSSHLCEECRTVHGVNYRYQPAPRNDRSANCYYRDRPSANRERHLSTYKDRSAHQERSTANQEWSTGNQEWSTGHQEWLTANQEWSTQYQERPTAHQERSTAHQEWSYAHQERPTAHQERSTAHQDRSNAHQERSSAHQERSNAHQERSTAHQERSTAHQERSNAHQERSTAQQERSNAHQDWATSHQDWSTAHQERSPTHQERSTAHQERSIVNEKWSPVNKDWSTAINEWSTAMNEWSTGNKHRYGMNKERTTGNSDRPPDRVNARKHRDELIDQLLSEQRIDQEQQKQQKSNKDEMQTHKEANKQSLETQKNADETAGQVIEKESSHEVGHNIYKLLKKNEMDRVQRHKQISKQLDDARAFLLGQAGFTNISTVAIKEDRQVKATQANKSKKNYFSNRKRNGSLFSNVCNWCSICFYKFCCQFFCWLTIFLLIGMSVIFFI